jgi:hypothetical protein
MVSTIRCQVAFMVFISRSLKAGCGIYLEVPGRGYGVYLQVRGGGEGVYLEVPRGSYGVKVERLYDEMDRWQHQAGIGLCKRTIP